MKKIIMLSIIAILAAGLTGCSTDPTDNTKADMRWINKEGNTVSEIQWMSSSAEDQRWSGSFANTEPTGYKGITKLTGNGEALFADDGSGIPQPIVVSTSDTDLAGISSNDGSSVTVAENANATLVIQTYTKKK